MNTGVGNISLLQVIFLTHELKRGHLHCRWVLYKLSYQGCPYWSIASLQHCANFCCTAKWLSNTHIVILFKCFFHYGLSQDIVVAKMIKDLPAMQKTWVQYLLWEDPLKKGMATHSGILAWRTPWTEEPGRLQSIGSQRVRHDWSDSTHAYIHMDFQIHFTYVCVYPFLSIS